MHALHPAVTRQAARYQLGVRACHRVLRVARTIVDIKGRERAGAAEVAEAVGYRALAP